MSKKSYKYYLYAIIIFFFVTLIPLMILSFYNHPSVDDFSFAKWNNNVWVDTHSLMAVLKSAVWTIGYFWENSQGTYTSAFIMSLQPAMFGEKYYSITGFINIGGLLFTNVIFMYVVVNNTLKLTGLEAVVAGVISAVMMIQWMPSGVSGLYWYNGSIHYTLAFCIFLFMISVNLYANCSTEKKKNIWGGFLSAILAFLLAGENYVTAFAGILFLSGMLLFNIFKRKKYILIGSVLPLVCNMVGLLLNALSPGTRRRQSNLLNRPGVIKTIWLSFFKGCEYINSWFDLSKIICVMLLVPILYRCAKMLKDRGFKFKCPLAVTVLSIGYISALFCPPYYAMGMEGSGRLTNVIYFAFIILLFVNVTYWLGWLLVRLEEENVKAVIKAYQNSKWKIYVPVCLIVMLLCVSTTKTHAFTAIKSLISGEAKIYSEECYARDDLLENSAGKDVVVTSYSVRPKLLYFDDISDNPEDWRNRAMTLYYRLNSVVKSN